jgi:hypothetical protein
MRFKGLNEPHKAKPKELCVRVENPAIGMLKISWGKNRTMAMIKLKLFLEYLLF